MDQHRSDRMDPVTRHIFDAILIATGAQVTVAFLAFDEASPSATPSPATPGVASRPQESTTFQQV